MRQSATGQGEGQPKHQQQFIVTALVQQPQRHRPQQRQGQKTQRPGCGLLGPREEQQANRHQVLKHQNTHRDPTVVTVEFAPILEQFDGEYRAGKRQPDCDEQPVRESEQAAEDTQHQGA